MQTDWCQRKGAASTGIGLLSWRRRKACWAANMFTLVWSNAGRIRLVCRRLVEFGKQLDFLYLIVQYNTQIENIRQVSVCTCVECQKLAATTCRCRFVKDSMNTFTFRLFIIIDEFRIVLGGQPTPFFFTTDFYPAGRQRKRDRAKHARWGRRKIRFNLFRAPYSKLLMPTCFAISGHPWQWVETKWRWLATQDHAKLVYSQHIHSNTTGVYKSCDASGWCSVFGAKGCRFVPGDQRLFRHRRPRQCLRMLVWPLMLK